MYQYFDNSITQIKGNDVYFKVLNKNGFIHTGKVFLENLCINNNQFEFNISKVFVFDEKVKMEEESLVLLTNDIKTKLGEQHAAIHDTNPDYI